MCVWDAEAKRENERQLSKQLEVVDFIYSQYFDVTWLYVCTYYNWTQSYRDHELESAGKSFFFNTFWGGESGNFALIF